MAHGTTSGDGLVTATLEDIPSNAAIVVSRYSGVDSVEPIGALVSGNTNGESGLCSGGSDSLSYAFSLSTTAPDALVYVAAARRNKSHDSGTGYTELVEFTQGTSGGSAAGLTQQQQLVANVSTVTVDGAFSSQVDWAVAGVEIKPLGSSVPVPDIAVTPGNHDYGTLLVNTTGTQTFEVRNDGNLALNVQVTSLLGVDALEFNLEEGSAPFTLLPGETQDIVVSFNPTSTGGKSARLRIESDDPDEPVLEVPLMGESVTTLEPDIAVAPDSHDYGEAVSNTTVFQTFEVRNDGNLALNVQVTSLLGVDALEFNLEEGSAPFTLLPGETQDIVVSFNPTSTGGKSARLRIESDDPDEPVLEVPLMGAGIDLPAGGSGVAHEESQSGGSSDSTSVSTAANVTGVIGHLYLAAITTKKFQEVVSVTGLELVWNRLIQQCAGRNQTGIEVWTARGIPSGDGQVSAELAAAPNSAAIVVSRYAGVDAVEPIGTLVSGNTNGESGLCSGGSDSLSYAFPFTTTAHGALIYAAAAMRNKAHEPGAAYTELVEFIQGTSGSNAAGLAIQERVVPTASTVPLDGAFSSSVDWAVAGVELKPLGSSIPVPDITVVPNSHNYGVLLVNANVSQSFEIRNDGEADLTVDSVSLVGIHASEFSLGNVDLPFVLPQGQSQNVPVSFNPTTTGIKQATLHISNDDPNEHPFNVPLTGRAVDTLAPDIVVDPTDYDYGTVVVNVGISTIFEVRNDGINNLTVTGTTLLGADASQFALVSGEAPFTLASGETRDVEVSFTPTAEGSANATLRIVSNDPDEGEVDVALMGSGLSVANSGAMWISAAELALRPMSGSAWDSLKATADGDLGTADIADLHSRHDIRTLAVALVYARTGDPFYRQKAADAIISAIGTDAGGSAHALGRNGASYIISADLINLAEYDPAADATFRSWLDAARFVERSDGTLIEEDESRANNHGRYAGATRVAIAVYLGDQAEIERAAQVFKGLLGDRASYNGFAWKRDLSWQADPTQPVGINPLGAVKDGYTIDGALPEEMRRGCAFQSPPCYTQYPWEGLQGILIEAVLLSRQGYDVFNWEDRAILRSIQFLDHLRITYPQDPWWAIGDDTFIPWLINAIYGTTFVTTSPIQLGDIMGWTDWTHAP